MKNGSGVGARRYEGWAREPAATDIPKIHQKPAKRAFDLAVAAPLFVLVSPLLMVIYGLLKIFDPGPALFRHTRVGRDGQQFTVYKFRTMRVDAEQRLKDLLASDPAAAAEWAQFQKLRNDPRVTPLGRVLRKSSLDELPQLFNILRGEMSIVGPRPVTPQEVSRYGADYSYFVATRPGVVGLWQIRGRNTLTYPERVAYDVQYVRTWSVWLDIKILALAVPVVLFGVGAY